MSSDKEGAYVNIGREGDPDEGNFVLEWGQEEIDVLDPDVDKSVCRVFSRLYTVARVKVQFDLNGPLVVGTVVCNRLGLETWLSFTYERLGSFCYRCGKLDHTVEQCLAKPRRDEGQRTRSRSSFDLRLRAHAPTTEDGSTTTSLVATNLHDGWVKSLALVAKEILTTTPLTAAAKSAFLKKLVRSTKMVYPDLEYLEEKKQFNN
ncbi:hypothetical protein Tsubulata_042555 [Turnera subulata]|uniref:CCHC-type domain-containing protein n=1 Tax=Turnera subulata TaxID=218843 RepID=A0A9Q0GDL1_9ROSI|nr:hypothetical protein Tsubulata_042555 [Turnera subulata]